MSPADFGLDGVFKSSAHTRRVQNLPLVRDHAQAHAGNPLTPRIRNPHSTESAPPAVLEDANDKMFGSFRSATCIAQ
jgi:hypothetical protein